MLSNLNCQASMKFATETHPSVFYTCSTQGLRQPIPAVIGKRKGDTLERSRHRDVLININIANHLLISEVVKENKLVKARQVLDKGLDEPLSLHFRKPVFCLQLSSVATARCFLLVRWKQFDLLLFVLFVSLLRKELGQRTQS